MLYKVFLSTNVTHQRICIAFWGSKILSLSPLSLYVYDRVSPLPYLSTLPCLSFPFLMTSLPLILFLSSSNRNFSFFHNQSPPR